MTTGASPPEAEGREPERDEPGGFVGRGGWHLVAFLAALALVLVMSIDWYTTEQGEEFRRVEKNSSSARQVDPDIDTRAAQAAENQEKTAWQADALVDRLILLACLIAFIGAVVAAFMRSAGRRPQPPWHPSAIATVAGVAGTLLILYRMFQPPGLNEAAVIKTGAPLGLIAIGVLTIASRLAVLGERDELSGGAVAAGAGVAVGEQESREPGDGPLSRLRRRREAAAEASVAETAAPSEDAAPAESTGFEFDFPAAAPPSAGDREEAEPEPEPYEEPPAEEPPPAAAELEPDAAAVAEDPYEEAPPGDEAEEEPEPLPEEDSDEDQVSEDDEHVLAAAVEEEPVEEPVEEDPVEEPVEDLPVEDPPIEEPPVEPPTVEEPPVEEPPVETPDEPLAIGEEIEFEYDAPPPDPDSRDDDPDRPEND